MKRVIMSTLAWALASQGADAETQAVAYRQGLQSSQTREVETVSQPAPVGRLWQVPRWVMVGILARETRSRLDEFDHVEYMDQRRGSMGERGPTQVMPSTFVQYAKKGETFAMLETNTHFALDFTERILLDHKRVLGTWEQAIRAYNAGRGGRKSKTAAAYYHDVRRLADR